MKKSCYFLFVVFPFLIRPEVGVQVLCCCRCFCSFITHISERAERLRLCRCVVKILASLKRKNKLFHRLTDGNSSASSCSTRNHHTHHPPPLNHHTPPQRNFSALKGPKIMKEAHLVAVASWGKRCTLMFNKIFQRFGNLGLKFFILFCFERKINLVKMYQ